jgi:hypothetical protein
MLTLIWRDPKKQSEVEALKRLVGMYGLAQWMWHGDMYCCKPLGGALRGRDSDSDSVLVGKNLKDFDIEVLEDDAGEKITTIVSLHAPSCLYVLQLMCALCRSRCH